MAKKLDRSYFEAHAAKPHTLVVNYPGIDLAHLDVALNILNSLL